MWGVCCVYFYRQIVTVNILYYYIWLVYICKCSKWGELLISKVHFVKYIKMKGVWMSEWVSEKKRERDRQRNWMGGTDDGVFANAFFCNCAGAKHSQKTDGVLWIIPRSWRATAIRSLHTQSLIIEWTTHRLSVKGHDSFACFFQWLIFLWYLLLLVPCPARATSGWGS